MRGAQNADLWVLKGKRTQTHMHLIGQECLVHGMLISGCSKGKRQATVLHGQLLLVFLIKLHCIKVFAYFHKVFHILVWPLHTENTSIWEFACVVVISALEISIDTSIWGFTGALEISLTQAFGVLLVL